MRHRNLNRLRIELHGKLNGPLDRLRRFTWMPDLEIAVHHKAQLLAIFHELARLLDRGAFLDVLQNLRIAGLEPDDQQPAASLFHRLQGLVARRHPGVAGPGKLQRLESLADLDRAVLGPGKRVIVEENFLRLGEVLQAALHLLDHVGDAAGPPGVPAHRLRPETEGTQRRASTGRVEGHVGVLQIGNVVARDVEVPLIDIHRKGQGIEILDLRAIRIVDDASILAEADAGNLLQLLSPGKLDRKSTRLNSSHLVISYAVFCLKKKKKNKFVFCEAKFLLNRYYQY